ncbi:uncharacterized protein LOC111710934 [Eurytemora carolleeae]|uniref:uncharacterized protein LOC111710934 n=1 Tax=Eurytemora carolleeae TaxID=1294199 RepID=UPI000C78D5D6|nr:uncharacterized protein LOC111710934 [Eurytemora carolleeae]|eukprot:XP_023340910.1 uncharacterized protein LOC111710934 [Eurytemora affinis]
MAGKAKLSLDQIKAFNIAAVKFETQGADKSLEDVDKIVNALSQINSTEVWNSSSPDISDLLFNCGQLIQVLDYKCGTTWNLISLLYKIRDSSILSQKAGQLLPVLARLLHSIPSTTHTVMWGGEALRESCERAGGALRNFFKEFAYRVSIFIA